MYNLENEKSTLLQFKIQRDTMATDAYIRNQSAQEMSDIQMSHMKDLTAKMREEAQFAQRMQSEQAAKLAGLSSESAYIKAHALNKQTEVLKAGMENIGQMGGMNLGGGDGHMNPAGMMTGMMMGASMGKQVSGMMAQMGQTMQGNMSSTIGSQMTPPPIPTVQQTVWYVVINGTQSGPYDTPALGQLITMGQVNADTLAWCVGMPTWESIGKIPTFSSLFHTSSGMVPPPIPTIP